MKNWVFSSLIVELDCFHWVHKFLVLNNKTRIIFEVYRFHSAKYSHWSSKLHDHRMLLNPWFFIKADFVYQFIVDSLCHFKTLWKFREFDQKLLLKLLSWIFGQIFSSSAFFSRVASTSTSYSDAHVFFVLRKSSFSSCSICSSSFHKWEWCLDSCLGDKSERFTIDSSIEISSRLKFGDIGSTQSPKACFALIND